MKDRGDLSSLSVSTCIFFPIPLQIFRQSFGPRRLNSLLYSCVPPVKRRFGGLPPFFDSIFFPSEFRLPNSPRCIFQLDRLLVANTFSSICAFFMTRLLFQNMPFAANHASPQMQIKIETPTSLLMPDWILSCCGMEWNRPVIRGSSPAIFSHFPLSNFFSTLLRFLRRLDSGAGATNTV